MAGPRPQPYKMEWQTMEGIHSHFAVWLSLIGPSHSHGSKSGKNIIFHTIYISSIHLCHSLISQKLQIIVLGLVAAVSALPTYPVRSETRQETRDKRSAEPTYPAQTTFALKQGATTVLRSQSHCVSGDGNCKRAPPLPTIPEGRGPYRSETRQEIRDKRSADPSV